MVVVNVVVMGLIVLLIRRRKACYNHNINQEHYAGGDSKQLCKHWFRGLNSGHNLVFRRLSCMAGSKSCVFVFDLV